MRRLSRTAQAWGLVLFGSVVTAVATVGGLAASGSSAEYERLRQPDWAPPGWLFGPVWTVLYALIALAGWLVWRRAGSTRALSVYGAQLLFNAAWTPLFFGLGRYDLALVDVGILWVLIGVTIVLFRRFSAIAALLLVPYWVWVSYATALNLAIWRLNS